jgi:2-polyprenyl-3-methyl-5-hydroxy-6-metoxy-1,4-benzoquinol methylase
MNRTDFIKNNMFGKILDVGCEGGTLHKLIEREEVYGMDIKIKKYKKRIVQGNAQNIPFKHNSFHTIIAGELIEHLIDPKKFLEECYRILKKKGIIILSTPNKKSWLNRLLKSSYHPAHVSLLDSKLLRQLVNDYFFIEKLFYLPYDSISSWGSKHKRFYWFRKLIHYFIPKNLQENIILLGRKKDVI